MNNKSIKARIKEEYEETHLVNAINIPYDEIVENTKLNKASVYFKEKESNFPRLIIKSIWEF